VIVEPKTDNWRLPATFRHGVDRPEVRIVRPLQHALWRTAGFDEPPTRATLTLRIELRDEQLNVKQLAAYLAFADRVYGRLSFGSLRRYARRERDQLTISEARTGSLILLIKEVVDALASPQGIILTGLALKYLPEVIKAPAAAYRDYEQGRLHRAERKRLLALASTDDALRVLQPRELSQLTAVLLKIYELEQHRLASAQSFAIRSVLDVELEGGTEEASRPAQPAGGKPKRRRR
jgi:hypothetical protein